MKKKLSYRDQLIELASIYGVREILEYIKNRKNLTTGQLELILKKNKIVIPKDFKTPFIKENFNKQNARVSRRIEDLNTDRSRTENKITTKIT